MSLSSIWKKIRNWFRKLFEDAVVPTPTPTPTPDPTPTPIPTGVLIGVEFIDPLNGHVEGMPSITLAKLNEVGISSVRVHPRGARTGANPYRHPFRYLYSGRYDLDQWDDDYWRLLRIFVGDCGFYDIDVAYELLNQSEFKGAYDSKLYCPWYALNNVNGYVKSGTGYTDIGDGIFTTKDPVVSKMREYVDKVIGEIGGNLNVTIHTCNEPQGGDQLGWHTAVVRYLREVKRWSGQICVNFRSENLSATDKAILSLDINQAEYHTTDIGKAEKFIAAIRKQAPAVVPIITTDTGQPLSIDAMKVLAKFSLQKKAGFRYWRQTGNDNIVWDYIKALGELG